eukprot:augustus_masked-scaffold_69-processed-gene-0.66-mRNA-1 protein AED:0.10 eAED:0.17 QI:0/-1/0/1/-1/1/1/0/401
MNSVPKASSNKPALPLSIGDPTVFGNLEPPKCVIDSLSEVVKNPKNYCYPPSVGFQSTREEIAKFHSRNLKRKILFDDVILTSGCSGAIELLFKSLLSENSEILLPNPGFPLYTTILNSNEFKVDYYNLKEPNPDDERSTFSFDVEDLENKLNQNENITCILVTNPSNPIGTVLGEQEIKDILAVCEKYQIAIVTDEIYGDICFGGRKFHAFAEIRDKYEYAVDVITMSGVAKEFLSPGLRVGWIVFNEYEKGNLENVRRGVENLSMVILGPNSITQKMIEQVINTQDMVVHKKELAKTLESNGSFFVEEFNKMIERNKFSIKLRALPSEGAMYVMIQVQGEGWDGKKFFERVQYEQNLIFLPGHLFGSKGNNYVRAVITPPKEILKEAVDRIEEFCIKNC